MGGLDTCARMQAAPFPGSKQSFPHFGGPMPVAQLGDARFGYLVPALVGGLAGTGRVVETPSSLINTPHSWGCRAWFTCLNPFQGFPPRCQPISSVPELALQHPPPGFREIDFPLRCLLFNCIVTAKLLSRRSVAQARGPPGSPVICISPGSAQPPSTRHYVHQLRIGSAVRLHHCIPHRFSNPLWSCRSYRNWINESLTAPRDSVSIVNISR